MNDPTASALIEAARALSREVDRLAFGPPVAAVYNPLEYAWEPHREYLARYGAGRKRVLFVGMNPGPWGMAQTGVPFGEIEAVRDWMGITGRVGRPRHPHPARPVSGFACRRREASGRRLWGLMRARFAAPEAFFREHLVVNYCPLAFFESDGANRVPGSLRAAERRPLLCACGGHLRRVIGLLEPEWVIGVGRWAEDRILEARDAAGGGFRAAHILHPSPANPRAGSDWGQRVTGELVRLGVWAESAPQTVSRE